MMTQISPCVMLIALVFSFNSTNGTCLSIRRFMQVGLVLGSLQQSTLRIVMSSTPEWRHLSKDLSRSENLKSVNQVRDSRPLFDKAPAGYKPLSAPGAPLHIATFVVGAAGNIFFDESSLDPIPAILSL